jgi:hypothetical protein
LSLEPLATYYLRRAQSYRFVREVCSQAFGPEGMGRMRRMTAAGPANIPLDSELARMQALFHGAHLRSCEEIGLAPEADPSLGGAAGAQSNYALAAGWLSSMREDPDLGRDIRMMVPVFYDVARRQTKVWAILGVSVRPLEVAYQSPPAVVAVTDPKGKPLSLRNVRVRFEEERHITAYFATAEVYAKRLLDRTEFRRHCDKYKTYRAIIDHL